MIVDPQIGDRVLFCGKANRSFNPGEGTVSRVSEKRVSVIWDKWQSRKQHYLAKDLERVEPGKDEREKETAGLPSRSASE